MKKGIKTFAAGLLIGATVAATSGAFGYTDYIEAVYNNIKIVVNGKEIHPSSEPFISNGTTYLPIRAVAEALGQPVDWDGPNYTVYIGTVPSGGLTYPSVNIEDMANIGTHEIKTTDELTDNYGNRYTHAICNAYGNAPEHEFLLNMKYSSFKGTLYVPQGQNADNSAYLKIIADGKIVYTSPEMTKSSYPVDIDVNLKGYNDVKIQFSEGVGFWSTELLLCLGNAGFYQ